MTFTPLPDHELDGLSDDRLVAYGRAAREAGDHAAARTALAILVWGHERDVARRVALRVDRHVVDEVTHDVLVRAFGAAFDGSSVGELRSWLNTITERTCVDWVRRQTRRVREAPLATGGPGDGSGPTGPEPALDGEAGAVEIRILVDDILAGYATPHREVIELHVLEGRPAGEVCGRIKGMSEDNVAKIASRFRARLRAELEAEPGGGR